MKKNIAVRPRYWIEKKVVFPPYMRVDCSDNKKAKELPLRPGDNLPSQLWDPMMKDRQLKGSRTERHAIVKAATSTAQRENVHRDHLQSKIGVFERLNQTVQEMKDNPDIRRVVQWELESRFFVQAEIVPEHLRRAGFSGREPGKIISALKANGMIDTATNRLTANIFSADFRQTVLDLDQVKTLPDEAAKNKQFEQLRDSFFDANMSEELTPTRLLERYYFETLRNLWFLLGGDNSSKCAEDAIVYLVCDPLIGTAFFSDCATESGHVDFVGIIHSLIEKEDLGSQSETIGIWLKKHPDYDSLDTLDIQV